MSIRVSSLVWESSRQKSGNLLVLLAIADHADEQGVAWPGLALLARKTRLSERHVRRCLNALATADELDILPDASPAGGPLYRIRIADLPAKTRTAAPEKGTQVSAPGDAGVIPSIRESSKEPSKQTDSHQDSAPFIKIHSRPELDDVLRFVSQKKDLDGAVAEIWWHECEACGWVDSHARPIVNWQSAFVAYSRKWAVNAVTHKSTLASKPRGRVPRQASPTTSSSVKEGF